MKTITIVVILKGVMMSAVMGQFYIPDDNIAIDCGAQGSNVPLSGRTWEGDVNSKLFPANKASWAAITAASTDTGIDVPYKTARVSSALVSYTLPVTLGPKFIRLHFYAGPHLNTTNTSFSVSAAGYALLHNFTVSVSGPPVAREYCLVVQASPLVISFTPDAHHLALVNGIEVVSMPSDLYYTQAASSPGLPWAAQPSKYVLTNSVALETVYRLDVGADREVPPGDDTGMFRSWGTDLQYLTIRGYSLVPVRLDKAPLNFSSSANNYTAPETVYNTARSLGNNEDPALLRTYNLTWEFPVDPNFNYMLRLHFCEIVAQINKTGDRVFQIFVANQSVERAFDVLHQTRTKYVPYFRDYVCSVFGDGTRKHNLTLALHASQHTWESTYSDAILNGLEIFKLSDTNKNLAGLNPDFVAPRLPADVERPNGKRKGSTVMIGIVAGVVSGAVILLALVGAFFIRRGKRVKDSAATTGSEKTTGWGPISYGGTTVKSSKTQGSSTLPTDLCRCFSLPEIKSATNDFDDVFIIGVGGFGNVYKGYIDNATVPVAIKRLKTESSQGAHEFKTEIEMLSHLRHRHLVSLIGYCDDRGEMILVYEYMSRGTLRDHLYKLSANNPPLTWRRRLEACAGAARGLHYLHTGAKHTIIHRDVKTTNILLDDKWVAKVSDFGLSKVGSTETSKGHVSTVVKGSFGYLDPEYYRRQQLTEKSDVYSFGVVLCEVLCGRPPVLRTATDRRQINLAELARSSYRNGTLGEIVDPNLAGKIAPECLKKYGEIAISCMLDNGADRPSMNDVVWALEFAIQLQQTAQDVGEIASTGDKGVDEVALINSGDETTTRFSWDDTSEIRGSEVTKISSSENESATPGSTNVFSEIYDPKAR